MKNKIFALFLVCALVFALFAPAAAQGPAEIRVELDGTALSFDVAPISENGRVLVPVRFLFEALGGTVHWNPTNNLVTATMENGDLITLTIGGRTIALNGQVTQMDVPSRAVEGRTLVPVRFVAEVLGLGVQWDSARNTVVMTRGGARILPLEDMTVSLSPIGGISVHSFHLAQGNLSNWAGEPVPAPMAGIIALPNQTGPRPLVLIMHGAMPIDDLNHPAYAGFDYLVAQLAAEGFVAMSINVFVEYSIDQGGESIAAEWGYALFEQHLERLAMANAGQDMGYGIDLTGRLNLDEIHIIGHSRGGELADWFYRRDREADISRIASIIRIGSTVVPFHSSEEAFYGPHPSIPVGIILPEFDGDVTDGISQMIFDEIKEAGSPAFASLVYLRGANHNFFNRAFEPDDRLRPGSNANPEDQSTWRTRPQQEDFLTRYAVAFLRTVTGAQVAGGTFSPELAQPRTMFGHPVLASTYIPGARNILATAAPGAPAATGTGGATAEFYLQAWDAEGLFNHPAVLSGRDRELALYDLQWTGQNGAVSFTLLERNFAESQALSLYVAMDASSSKNAPGQNQVFTVTLQDNAGNRQSVVVPAGTPALSWHPGEVEHNEWWGDIWHGFMPLGELRIPLRFFTGLDLSNIASLTISFDQTNSGAVMLSGIYLK